MTVEHGHWSVTASFDGIGSERIAVREKPRREDVHGPALDAQATGLRTAPDDGATQTVDATVKRLDGSDGPEERIGTHVPARSRLDAQEEHALGLPLYFLCPRRIRASGLHRRAAEPPGAPRSARDARTRARA